MSLLASVQASQKSLEYEFRSPVSSHILHISPARLSAVRTDVRSLLGQLKFACTAFADGSSARTSALRGWCNDHSTSRVQRADRPPAAKRRRFGAPPVATDEFGALEWLVEETESGLTAVRKPDSLMIRSAGFVVEVDSRGKVRFHYGEHAKEAPWVESMLEADMRPASLGPKLEALATLDEYAEKGRNIWETFGELRQNLLSTFRSTSLDEGFLLTNHDLPWVSILYDAPAELLLTDAWQNAQAKEFVGPDSEDPMFKAARIEIQPNSALVEQPFRAILSLPLVISAQTGHALSQLFKIATSKASESPLAGSNLHEDDIEALLAPALVLNMHTKFEYPGKQSVRSHRFTCALPSGIRGFLLERFDFETIGQLKEALKIVQRQVRLNNLFTSCFGPKTISTPGQHEFWVVAESQYVPPRLSELLAGSYRSPNLPVDVRFQADRVLLSLPSHKGREIRLEINWDYSIIEPSGSIDIALGERVLRLSRGSVPLLLRKLALDV